MRSFTTLSMLAALCGSFLPTAQAAILTLDDLSPGDLAITEFLANPAGVADSEGEYFEVLNRRNSVVDLTGLVVRDDGSNSFTVSELTLDAGAFGVFGNGDGSALGLQVDYIYGASMSLTNTADEITLTGAGGQELFRLAYTDGDAYGAGVANELAVLLPGLTSAADADYRAATQPLLLGNLGSPGSAGSTSLPAVPLPGAAWLLTSALVFLAGMRRRLQSSPGCSLKAASPCPGI